MPQRILVVEDEPDVVAVCRTLCDPSRFEIVLAANLEAARLWLERSRDLDLAVVDAVLADGRGTDFCRELKAARPSVPVLVVAASAAHLEEARQVGADAVLLKPFGPEALETALGQLLGGPLPAGATLPRILHPTDFSPAAERARAEAIRLARALGAELTLMHVLAEPVLYGRATIATDELERLFGRRRQWAADTLEARALDARAAGVPAHPLLVHGAPDREIVRVAGQIGARLIVMGAAGGGAGRILLGSIADRVIRSAPCPVVTVHAHGEAGRVPPLSRGA